MGAMNLMALILAGFGAVTAVIARAVDRSSAGPGGPARGAASHPDLVITLVHGAWARNASWTRADSPLCSAVQAAFPRALLVPCRWSGGNTLRARCRATTALVAHLRGLLVSYPGAHHFVIAHSHGGNIAMYALRDAELQRRLEGLVCLSTPFLHVRPRSVSRIAAFALVGAALLLPLILREAVVERCCPSAPVVVELASVAIALAIGIALIIRLPATAARLTQRLALGKVDPSRCLLIRVAGDEASAALGVLQIMSWITTMIWVKPAQLLHAGFEAASGWSAQLTHYTRLIVLIVVLSAACLTGSATLADVAPDWLVSSLLGVGLTGAAATAIFALVRAAPGHLLVLGFYLLGILFAPLPILLAVALLPFGPGLAPFATLLDVSAEPTPPGSWQVHQLPTQPPHEPISLMHSASYQLPEAIHLIVSWLRHRLASVAPPA
jgi:hypothetical protein